MFDWWRTLVFLGIVILGEGRPSQDQQQILQSLTHWNWDLPPPQKDSYSNTLYDPLKITPDAARTWNPMYPHPKVLSGVEVTLTPVCDWPESFEAGTGLSQGFIETTECSLDNKTDVSVILSMNYSVYQGSVREGYKTIADAPSSTSPVPWIKNVKDGNDVPLKYTLYRDSASKKWWVHYLFAEPISNAVYTVQLEYQLRKVLTGRLHDSNKFQAGWLQEWDAPVQSMDIVWVFPDGFKPKHFTVSPENQERDDEPSERTALCCGNNDTTGLSKCTYDLDLGREWASNSDDVNNCLNQTVVLKTSLRLADGLWADVDHGVDLKNLYEISFSPGIVTQSEANVASGRDWSWVLPLLLILVFPCLAAIFWTLKAEHKDQARKERHYA